MKWTLEEENRLAILLSIIDIGGYGTKPKVLNNIQDKTGVIDGYRTN